jgi:hypothetical protein
VVKVVTVDGGTWQDNPTVGTRFNSGTLRHYNGATLMTTGQLRLPNRRHCETFDFQAQGLRFTCSVGRYDDGSLAEVFLTNGKAGSMAGINAQDAAVVCSLALQFGVYRSTPSAAP